MLASVLTKVGARLTRRGCSQVALRSLIESAILDLSQACRNLIKDIFVSLQWKYSTLILLMPEKRK